jgi:Zn-dependent protease
MRDLVSWSIPIGRLFGISVRVHWLFPLVAIGLIARTATQPGYVSGTWIDATQLCLLMFVSVLFHEFGHCFAARSLEGDAHEILMWPLGGLAFVEVPHTPRANFLTAAAGPAVNLLLCLICAPLFFWLTGWEFRPPWNPFWYPWRTDPNGQIELFTWAGVAHSETHPAVIALARFMWINWVGFLFNVLVLGFPLDGGRMFQCALWPRYGFRQATIYAIVSGFIFALIFGVISFAINEVWWLFLALFIYVTCQQQWIILETGGEDSLMGYDFSQGYTSLEREAAPPRRRRPNFFQRWQQRRAARKLQQESEQREAEERRMDELLEKVQREGLQSLTDEERRFLTRVSAKYRNRH